MKDRYVLLVEDNPDDVKLTLKAFAKCGAAFKIEVAADGVEALSFLEARGEPAGSGGAGLPALILLDLKMPKMTGIEVLRRIRSERKTERVPVVVLTTSNEERDRTDSLALGVRAYLRKPVKFAEFRDLVQRIVDWVENSPSVEQNNLGQS